MQAGTESLTTCLQVPGLSGSGTGPGEEQPRPNPGGPMDRDNRVPLLHLKREQSAMGRGQHDAVGLQVAQAPVLEAAVPDQPAC